MLLPALLSLLPFLCRSEPPAPSHSSLSRLPDLILGVADHSAALVSDARARGVKAGGLRRFVASALQAAPEAYVVIASASAEFWLAADARLAAALRHPRVLLVPLRSGDYYPRRRLQGLRIQFARYWAYAPALAAARARLADRSDLDNRAALAGGPFILLSDTMDVAFQADPFARARALLRAAPPGVGDARPPLLVAAEPAAYGLASERINGGWLRSCFRAGLTVASSAAAAAAPPSSQLLPADTILCSGTTLGAAAAVDAYIAAMTRALPFCASAQVPSPGVDQSVHNVLLSGDDDAGAPGLRGVPAEDAQAQAAMAVTQVVSSALPPGRGYPRHVTLAAAAAVEPAYAAFAAVAAHLRAAVRVLRVAHEEGWVCTFGLLLISAHSVPLVRLGAQAPGAPRRLALAPSARGPPCAVVHQYDRGALATMVVEGLLPAQDRDEARVACERVPAAQGEGGAQGGGGVPAGGDHDCWTLELVAARLPPASVEDLDQVCREAPQLCARQ